MLFALQPGLDLLLFQLNRKLCERTCESLTGIALCKPASTIGYRLTEVPTMNGCG